MAITNGYCTLADLKAAIGIASADTTDDAPLEAAVEAASRQIDDQCGKGRKFWQDSTVIDRKYFPGESSRVCVDDISTLTGLVVKVDQDDDGTFETTLTINTDFIVEPVNADKEFPVRPWTSIRLLGAGLLSFPYLTSGRPSVQVSAKFGWSAVPDGIERACIFQSRHVFKAAQAQNGLVQTTVDGQVFRQPLLDPMARLSIEPFIRYDEVDDSAYA